METALKVKDFVIDIPKAIEEIKNIKKNKSEATAHNFEIILENNTDFVIHRITSTTDKNLVFLISQGVFYIKNNKTEEVETINEQKLRSFFQQIYYEKFEKFTKVGWWKNLRPEKAVPLMVDIVQNKTMQKMYQHNVFVEEYEVKRYGEAFCNNTKLFRYCYEKLDKNSKFGYTINLANEIHNKLDFNNAVAFINKLSESDIDMGLYYNGYERNSDYELFLSLIEKYNLNFNRYIEYLIQDLYSQGITSLNRDILGQYEDYLDMQIAIYGKVKEKYPKHLKTEHDIIALKFNTYKKYKKDLMIFNVTEKNKELTYSNKTYSIILPQTSMDIVDEGINQSSCVGSYVDKIVRQDSIVLFMRKTDELEKSLVTVEVKGNAIVQIKGFANRNINEDEEKFVLEWAKNKKLIYNKLYN